MNGPNFNLTFQKHVEDHLLKENLTYLDVGTCPQHIVFNDMPKV